MELAADQPGPSPGLQDEVERSNELLISSNVLTVINVKLTQTQRTVVQQTKVTQFGVTSACSEKPHFSFRAISESISAQNSAGMDAMFPLRGISSGTMAKGLNKLSYQVSPRLLVSTGHDVYMHLFGFFLKGGPETFQLEDS